MKGMVQSITLGVIKGLATLTSGSAKNGKLLILIYHRVLDKPDFMRPDEVDCTRFDEQMKLIANYFNVLTLHEAVGLMKQEKLPSRAVCVTFDDGYADNLLNATPILKKHGLNATFFIATGFLDGGRMWNDTVIEAVRNMPGKEMDLTDIDLGCFDVSSKQARRLAAGEIIRKIKHITPEKRLKLAELIGSKANDLPNRLMLTSDQLKELEENGMEVGGHTVTHPILSTLTKELAQKEIAEGKEQLEKLLDKELNYFAYPNGKPGQDYHLEQVRIVEECGFSAAVSTQWGVNTQNSDYFQLSRFTPWDKKIEKFMLRMALMYKKPAK
jgi:peptidoglycan/xylan/chitin deacetylase (PgdA/CDA1 family)